MRDQRDNDPLELFSLSACRTAVGDRDSELGFAGLALQAGARSAIGTLWYVDDVATSAVFLQLYRYLDDGYPKAEALQATRQDLIAGRIRLAGDRVLAADGQPLLQNLTLAQRQRIREGLSHPFFWAGITLLGSPW
jgi:CHAT domain-containing protein